MWLISVLDSDHGAKTLAELLDNGIEKAASFVSAARAGVAHAVSMVDLADIASEQKLE